MRIILLLGMIAAQPELGRLLVHAGRQEKHAQAMQHRQWQHAAYLNCRRSCVGRRINVAIDQKTTGLIRGAFLME